MIEERENMFKEVEIIFKEPKNKAGPKLFLNLRK